MAAPIIPQQPHEPAEDTHTRVPPFAELCIKGDVSGGASIFMLTVSVPFPAHVGAFLILSNTIQ